MWWYTCEISALGRWMQEGQLKLTIYIVTLEPAWAAGDSVRKSLRQNTSQAQATNPRSNQLNLPRRIRKSRGGLSSLNLTVINSFIICYQLEYLQEKLSMWNLYSYDGEYSVIIFYNHSLQQFFVNLCYLNFFFKQCYDELVWSFSCSCAVFLIL